MYPTQDFTSSKADQQERMRSRPVIGIRRSARLIAIEIRRSRGADHRR
ncbi:MAG: hypothetical protein M3171_05270 [Actinomycetota bacterium]|nr:hypothetical protein [Actinomycetota bacterium]